MMMQLRLRPPRPEDAPAITGVWIASDTDLTGDPDTDESDIHEYWAEEGFDLDSDAWVVEADEGIVGYAQVILETPPRTYQGVGVVHPEYRGRGIGSELVSLTETRTGEKFDISGADGPPRLHHFINGADDAAALLFKGRGYRLVRCFWHMERDLDDDLTIGETPPGIKVRTFRDENDQRTAHNLFEDAFVGHWGHRRSSFDEAKRQFYGREDFDRDICFLALEGDRVVGALTGQNYLGGGYVRDVAVIEDTRGRGIGELLLRHSFVTFRAKGIERAGLDVDSENSTGATRLYERVGLSVVHRYDAYGKELD